MPDLECAAAVDPVRLFGAPDVERPGSRALDSWCVLHTRPRAEKALARWLASRDLCFYLPLYERNYVAQRRVVRSLLPLFPGYVFLRGGEAVREAAAAVDELGPRSIGVVAYVPYPRDLEFYLGRPVEAPPTPERAARVCDRADTTILVAQPWILEPATFPCTDRPGVVHRRLAQYARGGHIDVWLLPPAA